MIRQLWDSVTLGSLYRRHVLVSSLTSIGLYGFGLITGPILARALGPAGRGDIAAVIAPATVLGLVLAFGMPTAAAYFVDTVPENQLLVTATSFGLVVGVPICGVLWFLVPTYLSGNSAAAVTWARVVLVILPLSVGASSALEVRRRLKPGISWNCWRSTPIVVPAVAIVFLAVADRLTLHSFFAAYTLGALLPIVFLLSRLAECRPWPRPSFSTFRLMLPYSWRAASIAASTSLTSRLDQIVLVGIVTPAQLGLYAVAAMVASVTNVLTSGLSASLFGHLRGESCEARADARFLHTMLATLLISSVVAVALALFAPVVLRVVFGDQFAPAAPALRFLLLGSVAYDMVGVITTKLFADGRPGEAAWSSLFGTIITVIGLIVWAPRSGIKGAAMVTSIAWASQVVFLVARGGIRRPSSRCPLAMLPSQPPSPIPNNG